MALAGGDLNKPMVVFCVNSERFAGYNLVLRLAALGYTYVHSTVRGPEEGRAVQRSIHDSHTEIALMPPKAMRCRPSETL
jgi:hypothetical protein